jgi:nitroimidazol reductase NimA-like FMN-containing flavoprotein (pyridoxamine 5'-phosphate oxidase superfamily)
VSDDLAAEVTSILDANLYVTVGTADAEGLPWVAPVYFATADNINLYWVSAPHATHSRNIAERPDVSLVVFDSQVPPYTGRAVYLRATALELSGSELERGVSIYPGHPSRGADAVTTADVSPPAAYRMYRATVSEHSILCPRDQGQPCARHGSAVDHRATVML